MHARIHSHTNIGVPFHAVSCVQADTHNVLTQMLAHNNALVSGAAALAIGELARHGECCHALLQANAMPLLARVARECAASTGASCACNAMAILW
jgi:hypothetical protein